MQQPSRLGPSSALNQLHPGDVAARPIDAGDKAALNRVIAAREDDRDCTGRLHGDERRIVASGCGDHGYLTLNEISRERRQSIRLHSARTADAQPGPSAARRVCRGEFAMRHL